MVDTYGQPAVYNVLLDGGGFEALAQIHRYIQYNTVRYIPYVQYTHNTHDVALAFLRFHTEDCGGLVSFLIRSLGISD